MLAGSKAAAGATLALTLLALPAAAADAPTVTEEWFVVRIADQPVGALANRMERRQDALLERSEFTLVLNRLGSRTEMKSTLSTEESLDGTLRRAELELDLSSRETGSVATVGDGVIRIRERSGASEFERQLPYAGELLGPGGVHRRSTDRLRGVGDSLSFQTYSAELGAVIQIVREVVAATTLRIAGAEVLALEIVETTRSMPVETRLWLARDGRLLRSEVPSPFGRLVTVRAEEAAARLATAGGALPAEAYAATLAHTQVRIPEPRRAERLVLEIRHRNPDLGWPDLERPGQRVLKRSGDRLMLEVERRWPRAAARRPAEPSDALRPYLNANAYLESDQPELVALAREIVGETDDAWQAALALQRWVAESMRFDLGVVFAPSSEVLAERRGTCTEYAVLLSALARAAGIPARFVMGFVYVGGIFGGHAWTEVLIGDDWLPIDGAVPGYGGRGAADAARITLLHSALDEGLGALSLGSAALLFGQIDVAVLSYRGAGPTLDWPAEAAPFEIEDDTYRNSALGLTWTKPDDLEWARLDAVWPDPVVVALEGPAGAAAALELRDRLPWLDPKVDADRWLAEAVPGASIEPIQPAATSRLAGRRAAGGTRAAAAWSQGSQTWRLTVEGPGAGRRLDQLLATLTLGAPSALPDPTGSR